MNKACSNSVVSQISTEKEINIKFIPIIFKVCSKNEETF